MLIVTRLLYPLSFLTLSALPPFTDLKGLGFSLSAESISLESNQYDYGEIIQLYGMPLDNLILNLKRLAVKKCEKIYTRGPKIWGNYASHTSFWDWEILICVCYTASHGNTHSVLILNSKARQQWTSADDKRVREMADGIV